MAEETNVLMGMATVLRPYWYFEYWYDRTTGQPFSGEIPIPLMPVNPNPPALANPPNADPFAYDEAARNQTAGYSLNLAAMMPCPMPGSDLLVWLPDIPSVSREANYGYLYVPQWRLRTPADWRNYKKQGQVRRESFGAEDTTLLGGDRYILPASAGSAILSGQQMDDGATNTLPGPLQTSMILREGIFVPATNGMLLQPPAGPTGFLLEYQQGILDPFGSPNRTFTSSMYRSMWLKTIGNEFGFLVYKIEAPQPEDKTVTFVDWDFDYDPATGYCSELADDCYFSSIYGVGADQDGYRGMFPNSGTFVMAGTTT